MSNTFQKQVYFIISNKGGVGKSTVAKAAADHVRYYGFKAALFDTDIENKNLYQVYGRASDDPLVGVASLDLDNIYQARQAISDATTLDASTIIYDLRGGALNTLIKSFDEELSDGVEKMIDFFNDAEIGINFLVVFNTEMSSIETCFDLLGLFKNQPVSFFWLLNIPQGEQYKDTISLWLDTPPFTNDLTGTEQTARQVLEQTGTLITFPRLFPKVAALLGVHKVPYRQINKENGAAYHLDRLDVSDVKSFVAKFDDTMAKLFNK